MEKVRTRDGLGWSGTTSKAVSPIAYESGAVFPDVPGTTFPFVSDRGRGCDRKRRGSGAGLVRAQPWLALSRAVRRLRPRRVEWRWGRRTWVPVMRRFVHGALINVGGECLSRTQTSGTVRNQVDPTCLQPILGANRIVPVIDCSDRRATAAYQPLA